MLARRPRTGVGAQALLIPSYPAEALVFDGLGKILELTVAGLYGQTAKK